MLRSNIVFRPYFKSWHTNRKYTDCKGKTNLWPHLLHGLVLPADVRQLSRPHHVCVSFLCLCAWHTASSLYFTLFQWFTILFFPWSVPHLRVKTTDCSPKSHISAKMISYKCWNERMNIKWWQLNQMKKFLKAGHVCQVILSTLLWSIVLAEHATVHSCYNTVPLKLNWSPSLSLQFTLQTDDFIYLTFILFDQWIRPSSSLLYFIDPET